MTDKEVDDLFQRLFGGTIGRDLSAVRGMKTGLSLAIWLAIAVTGCGGDDKATDSATQQKNSPAAATPDAAAEKAAVEKVVHRLVDDDACDVMSDRFLADGYSSAEEGRAACEEDTDPGLRRGEYTVNAVTVNGETATAELALDEGGKRIYGLAREGKSAWLVDSSEEEYKGRVKDTFTLKDSYEQDGNPVDVDLRITVLKVEQNAPAPEFFEAGPSKRWVRAKIKLNSRGKEPFSQSTEDFKLVDTGGRRYRSGGVAFEPSLGNGGVNLARGDTVVGFLGFKVPKKARLKAIRIAPTFSGGAPLEWRIR